MEHLRSLRSTVGTLQQHCADSDILTQNRKIKTWNNTTEQQNSLFNFYIHMYQKNIVQKKTILFTGKNIYALIYIHFPGVT